MDYYAIFLDNKNYITDCLALIRFISKPVSFSVPHITLRVSRLEFMDTRFESLSNQKIDTLNIIEPGIFSPSQGDQGSDNYIVYLRCESKQLELFEYKPDFPHSRFHITLYEGNNREYAKRLLEILEKYPWHFQLKFIPALEVKKEKIGAKKKGEAYFKKIYNQLLSDVKEVPSFESVAQIQNNIPLQLRIIENLLEKIKYHKNEEQNQYQIVKSQYLSVEDAEQILKKSVQQEEGQNEQAVLTNDGIKFEPIQKPVQDAIYVTPPEYALDMAYCAFEALNGRPKTLRFGDSAIGTGTLYLAFLQMLSEVNMKGCNYRLESAIGIDIDWEMAREALMKCGDRGLEVFLGDALSEDLKFGKLRNIMIVNPPYNRHEDIPSEYREESRFQAQKQTGISISGDAGLYVYHLLIMDKWLCREGIGVWLLPTAFLQTQYGLAVRKYLTEKVAFLKMHIYNADEVQFEKAMVSTTIIVFKKTKPSKNGKTIISYGSTAEKPTYTQTVTCGELKEKIGTWREFLIIKDTPKIKIASDIKFKDLFEIRRGIATGANNFFVVTPEKIKKNKIPSIALKPLLPKARFIKEKVIHADKDGNPQVDPKLFLIDCDMTLEQIKKEYPDFYAYLYAEQTREDSICNRCLVRKRKVWYKQEKCLPAPFLLTYMGRNKSDQAPLYFLYNQSKAVALNTYILLYPKPRLQAVLDKNDKAAEELLNALQATSKDILAQKTRIYSGGLQKIEPGELKALPIYYLPQYFL